MDVKKVPFEEALSMTGSGKFNVLMLFLVSSIIVAMAFETASVAYLVPASGCELQTTSEQQGLMAGMPLAAVIANSTWANPQDGMPYHHFLSLTTSRFLGILAASNVWGYLADTRGRRKILLIALILGFITGCLATISPNWIVFCICKFLSSSAMAGTFGLSTAYLSECTPASKRSRLIVLLTSIFATSIGCMAALTIPVLSLKFSFYIPFLGIYFNSWRLLNIIYSLPCAFAAAQAHLAFESPKFLLSVGENEKALEVLRSMYVMNTGEDGDMYKVSAVVLEEDSAVASGQGFWKSVISQTVPLLRPPLLTRTLLLSAMFVTVYICVNPFTVWVPYMVDGFMKSLETGERGLTFCQMLRSSQNATALIETEPNDCTLNHTAMMMVFGMDIILAVVNAFMSTLLGCCGRKTMYIAIQFIAGTAALVVNASTHWILTAVIIITFIMGMLNFGVLSTFSVDMFPTYVKAMGVCLTLMIGRGSAVLGINVLKNLLTYNCEASFYIFGSIAIGGGLLGFLLPSEKKPDRKDAEG